MVTKSQRLQFVNSFLNSLGQFRSLVANSRNDRVFELFCYFRKVDEWIRRGKSPMPQNVSKSTFAPHSKPGNPMTASYVSLQETNEETFDLFLNGRFRSRSGIEHSPDIALVRQTSGDVLSIYECKNHSGTLGLNYYREFIGYLEEMKLPIRGPGTRYYEWFLNLYPEMRPCIYTSAVANFAHRYIQDKYGFRVIDRL